MAILTSAVLLVFATATELGANDRPTSEMPNQLEGAEKILLKREGGRTIDGGWNCSGNPGDWLAFEI